MWQVVYKIVCRILIYILFSPDKKLLPLRMKMRAVENGVSKEAVHWNAQIAFCLHHFRSYPNEVKQKTNSGFSN